MKENVKLNLTQPIMMYAPGGHTEEIVLNFGIGRIAIDTHFNKETEVFAPATCVTFHPTIKTHKIGFDENAEISRDDLGEPKIVLSFTNEESLDAVIQALNDAKNIFKKHQTDEKEK